MLTTNFTNYPNQRDAGPTLRLPSRGLKAAPDYRRSVQRKNSNPSGHPEGISREVSHYFRNFPKFAQVRLNGMIEPWRFTAMRGCKRLYIDFQCFKLDYTFNVLGVRN